MKKRIVALLFAAFSMLGAAAEPGLKPLMLTTDQIVYQDEFAASKLLDKTVWKIGQNTRWVIEDGVLRGQPSTSEFQASHKTHKGLEPRISLPKCPPSYVVQFNVRYVDGKPIPALPDRRVPSIDLGHHIGRIEFGVEGTRLMADGETVLLQDELAFKLELGRWYHVMAEAHEDEVVVQFAGGPTFYGKHPTYNRDNHILAIVGLEGGVVEIDSLTLWSVKPERQSSWNQTLAKFPASEVKSIRTKTPGQIAADNARIDTAK